jgi:hypothetical protein
LRRVRSIDASLAVRDDANVRMPHVSGLELGSGHPAWSSRF